MIDIRQDMVGIGIHQTFSPFAGTSVKVWADDCLFYARQVAKMLKPGTEMTLYVIGNGDSHFTYTVTGEE